ncbi:MAG: helix-turn-helix transcriptional regulator [Alphaproteobacteria bacterium]|nr:helix-turn-helix transcriptional regulator [Alphaproteobacteria bacterium]
MGQKGCPIERAVTVLDGKWTLLILRELFLGTRRFGDLRRVLVDVSPKTLTDRLRELEAKGVVKRTIYPEIPPRVEYALTKKGERARPVIEALKEWGESLARS